MNLLAKIRARKDRRNEEREWAQRGYAMPSPAHIKRAVLLRHATGAETWVETGTFLGDTAALLAQHARAVHTIEPDPALYEQAARRFHQDPKVRVIRGLSEEVLPGLLASLSGPVNFWLDGHYSGGITHQGPIDCPVRQELQAIADHRHRFARLTVLIDDLRCFAADRQPEYAAYPSLDFLVDWARDQQLHWHIEHDILVAASRD